MRRFCQIVEHAPERKRACTRPRPSDHHIVAVRPIHQPLALPTADAALFGMRMFLRGLCRLRVPPLAGAAAVACPLVASASFSVAENEPLPPNPLRHGMAEDTLNKYVERLLHENPACNLAAIPDVFERQIYASVVRLVVDSLYWAVGKLHGMHLLGHHVSLRLSETRPPPPSSDTTPVRREALEAIVARLLTNESLNSRFLPDAVERELYLNVLVRPRT
jgi:hypothetical protein